MAFAGKSGAVASVEVVVAPNGSTRLRSVVLDCPDANALAAFYKELLDGTTGTEWVFSSPSWAQVRLPGTSVMLAFQTVTDYVAPQWPDGQPQQVHLDLDVDDLRAASARAVSLGAKVLSEPVEEDNCTFIVHQDPVGHTFCLCQLKTGAC